MSGLVPCPHRGCKGGKVHCLLGFDIFWNDCPVCEGSGNVKRRSPEINIETRPGSGNEKKPELAGRGWSMALRSPF